MARSKKEISRNYTQGKGNRQSLGKDGKLKDVIPTTRPKTNIWHRDSRGVLKLDWGYLESHYHADEKGRITPGELSHDPIVLGPEEGGFRPPRAGNAVNYHLLNFTSKDWDKAEIHLANGGNTPDIRALNSRAGRISNRIPTDGTNFQGTNVVPYDNDAEYRDPDNPGSRDQYCVGSSMCYTILGQPLHYCTGLSYSNCLTCSAMGANNGDCYWYTEPVSSVDSGYNSDSACGVWYENTPNDPGKPNKRVMLDGAGWRGDRCYYPYTNVDTGATEYCEYTRYKNNPGSGVAQGNCDDNLPGDCDLTDCTDFGCRGQCDDWLGTNGAYGWSNTATYASACDPDDFFVNNFNQCYTRGGFVPQTVSYYVDSGGNAAPCGSMTNVECSTFGTCEHYYGFGRDWDCPNCIDIGSSGECQSTNGICGGFPSGTGNASWDPTDWFDDINDSSDWGIDRSCVSPCSVDRPEYCATIGTRGGKTSGCKHPEASNYDSDADIDINCNAPNDCNYVLDGGDEEGSCIFDYSYIGCNNCTVCSVENECPYWQSNPGTDGLCIDGQPPYAVWENEGFLCEVGNGYKECNCATSDPGVTEHDQSICTYPNNGPWFYDMDEDGYGACPDWGGEYTVTGTGCPMSVCHQDQALQWGWVVDGSDPNDFDSDVVGGLGRSVTWDATGSPNYGGGWSAFSPNQGPLTMKDWGLIHGYGTWNCPSICPYENQHCCDQIQGTIPACCIGGFGEVNIEFDSNEEMIGYEWVCQWEYHACAMIHDQSGNDCNNCTSGGPISSDKKCCLPEGENYLTLLESSFHGNECYNAWKAYGLSDQNAWDVCCDVACGDNTGQACLQNCNPGGPYTGPGSNSPTCQDPSALNYGDYGECEGGGLAVDCSIFCGNAPSYSQIVNWRNNYMPIWVGLGDDHEGNVHNNPISWSGSGWKEWHWMYPPSTCDGGNCEWYYLEDGNGILEPDERSPIWSFYRYMGSAPDSDQYGTRLEDWYYAHWGNSPNRECGPGYGATPASSMAHDPNHDISYPYWASGHGAWTIAQARVFAEYCASENLCGECPAGQSCHVSVESSRCSGSDSAGGGDIPDDFIIPCTDPNAWNYDPNAPAGGGCDNWTCGCEYVCGCMDNDADNYNPDATSEGGNCEYHYEYDCTGSGYYGPYFYTSGINPLSENGGTDPSGNFTGCAIQCTGSCSGMLFTTTWGCDTNCSGGDNAATVEGSCCDPDNPPWCHCNDAGSDGGWTGSPASSDEYCSQLIGWDGDDGGDETQDGLDGPGYCSCGNWHQGQQCSPGVAGAFNGCNWDDGYNPVCQNEYPNCSQEDDFEVSCLCLPSLSNTGGGGSQTPIIYDDPGLDPQNNRQMIITAEYGQKDTDVYEVRQEINK